MDANSDRVFVPKPLGPQPFLPSASRKFSSSTFRSLSHSLINISMLFCISNFLNLGLGGGEGRDANSQDGVSKRYEMDRPFHTGPSRNRGVRTTMARPVADTGAHVYWLLTCLDRNLLRFFADGSFGCLETNTAVCSVTEGLGNRATAAAERERGLPCLIILGAVGIHQFDRTFRGLDTKRPVLSGGNLYVSH